MQLGDFTVNFLGVEFPDYFQGFMPHIPYDNSVYGIGDTEEAALDDCIMQFALCACVDVTPGIAHRIRDAYGDTNKYMRAAEAVGCESEYDDPFFHIGMQWNEV